jgi:hypothetical protein
MCNLVAAVGITFTNVAGAAKFFQRAVNGRARQANRVGNFNDRTGAPLVEMAQNRETSRK